MSELIRIGVERGRYVTDIGWSHKGLADFLIEHGMEARALAMDSRLPLDLMLADGWLAILSVRPLLLAQAIPSARDRIGGHLVLCHGFSKDQSGRLVAYLISDPDYDPAMRRIGSLVAAETVLDSWAHRAIVIKPPRSRLSQGAYDD